MREGSDKDVPLKMLVAFDPAGTAPSTTVPSETQSNKQENYMRKRVDTAELLCNSRGIGQEN